MQIRHKTLSQATSYYVPILAFNIPLLIQYFSPIFSVLGLEFMAYDIFTHVYLFISHPRRETVWTKIILYSYVLRTVLNPLRMFHRKTHRAETGFPQK